MAVLSTFGATSVDARTTPWTGLRARYEIETVRTDAAGASASRLAHVDSEVVDRQGNVLVVDTTVREEGTESRSTERIPTDALTPTIPGTATQQGARRSFERTTVQPNSDAAVHETGSVADNWFTEFSGRVPVANRGTFEFSFDLLEYDGTVEPGVDSGVLLLPLVVPPTRKEATATSETTNSAPMSQSREVTTQGAVTRYAYSRLITKDNQPANITTARSDLQAWGKTDSNDQDFVDAGYDWTHSTSPNWFLMYTDTTTAPWPGGADVYGTAAYQGYFPLSPYEHFRDFHYHDHFIQQNGHYTELTGTLQASEYASCCYVSFKGNTFYDGSTKYSTGSRQTGKWYII